jgi:hypothetical protein
VTVLTLLPLPLVIGRKRQRAKFRKVLGRVLVEDVAAGLVIGTTRKHKQWQARRPAFPAYFPTKASQPLRSARNT